MNLFIIITTLLDLFLCIYVAFKKENPTHIQNEILMVNPTFKLSHNLTKPVQGDIIYDNNNFKDSLLYYSILVLHAIIFVSWFTYGWSTLTISEEVPLLSCSSKITEVFFFSLLNTAKCTTLSICVLSCGLFYKNYKNPHISKRIFHLTTYALLSLSVIYNFIFLLKSKYTFFLPKASIFISTENIPVNLLLSMSPILLILEITLIVICIYKLIHIYIFGEYTSPRLRINFMHTVEHILAPIFFVLLTLYISFFNTYI